MSDELLFRKIVDKSTLYEGISIPVSCQDALFKTMGFSLGKGEQRIIRIEMQGLIYEDAAVKNQSFDGVKYPNRSDIVQIRYSTQSLLAKKIREVFVETDNRIRDYMEHHTDNMHFPVIPEENREYIDVYISEDRIRFECIPQSRTSSFKSDEDYGTEEPQRRDVYSSSFKRKANVIAKAKERAHGICQLCGNPAPFQDKQGNPYLEVHHVVWLSRGGADKLSNVVALCPNCHSKMHVLDDQKDMEMLLEKAIYDKS